MYKLKKIKTITVFLMLFLIIILTGQYRISARNMVNPPRSIMAMNNIFKQIAKKVMPSVVLIKVTRLASRRMHPFFRRFFRGYGNRRQRRRVRGVGSGVIISKKGYIITNYHVIRNAKGLSILTVNNREYKVKVVGSDKETDIAVLKIIGNTSKLRVAAMGNSDKVRPGEIVFALGNPFGLKGSITQGIISAVSRQTKRSYGYDFLQTDAAINPGNSGGPLVNIFGQVIGINRMIYTRTGGYMGIGFAIPINRVKEVINIIIKHGKVTRGYLGIIPANPDDQTSRKMKLRYGVKIAEVMEGSPAEKAGLKPWDVIISVRNRRIKNFSHLKRVIALTRPGKRIRVVVRRRGKIKRFTVILANRDSALSYGGGHLEDAPNRSKKQATFTLFGMTVRNLTYTEKRRLKVEYGVMIVKVKQDSSAVNSGVMSGDVILEIEGYKLTSTRQARIIQRRLRKRETFQMRIKRRGRIRFFVIEK